MRSFEKRLGELEAHGVRVAAISVDPPDVSGKLRRDRGYTFTFLADRDASVIRRYDLAHEAAGPDGEVIARPAEFLVDASGTIRWEDLTESIVVRTRPEQVLRAMDELGLGGSRPSAP